MTTRRDVLRAAPAALAAVAVPVEALASTAGTDDPAFAAIEAHRAAHAALAGCIDQVGDLEDELPADRRRTECSAWDEAEIDGDDPRWVAAQRALDGASDTEYEAACDLAECRPTTLQGAVALLAYAAEQEVAGHLWPTEIRVDGRWRSFHHVMAGSLAAALAGLA